MKKWIFLLLIMVTLSLASCTQSGSTTTTLGGIDASNDLFGNKTVDQWKDYYTGTVDIDNNQNGVPDWQETPITIDYAFRFYGEDDSTNVMFRNAQKWADQYPNITIERDSRFKVSAIPYDDDNLQLQTLVAASQDNSMPDIFYSPMAAELYDQGLTLDLTPYLRTDDEARFITQNALDFMRTYDGNEIYGVPFQSVALLPLVNIGLLQQYNIPVPSYDWSYADYESLRQSVGALTDSGKCVFPGNYDFSTIGTHYFDSIPNGWKGFNSLTQRFDFENAPNYGNWFQQVIDEGFQGWSWYDLPADAQTSLCGATSWPWGDGLEAVAASWFYIFNYDIDNYVTQRGLNLDVYPLPTAPVGGSTALQAYYDTLSLSYKLKQDPVKAEAVYNLLKWLAYGEDGTSSRWQIMQDDINTWGYNVDDYVAHGGDAANFPAIHPSTNLMDYILGWPVTTNPDVIKNHPLVKGFPEDSPFAVYNFAAFKNPAFQEQLSNPIAYPRQIPGAAQVLPTLDPWQLKVQMQSMGYDFNDVSGDFDSQMNELLDNYLRSFNN